MSANEKVEAPLGNFHFFLTTLYPLRVAQLIDVGINEHFVQYPDEVQVCGVFLVMIFHDLGIVLWIRL